MSAEDIHRHCPAARGLVTREKCHDRKSLFGELGRAACHPECEHRAPRRVPTVALTHPAPLPVRHKPGPKPQPKRYCPGQVCAEKGRQWVLSQDAKLCPQCHLFKRFGRWSITKRAAAARGSEAPS